jgi:uncharacterized protein (TIGR02246 family)
MPRVLIALTSVALFATSAIGAQTPTSKRAEIQRFVRAYIDAHNKADATALMEALKRSADVTSVNDGQITRGWEGIRTQTDELTGREGSFKLAIGTMDVTALGASYALVVAPTTITVATPQGPVEARGAMTLLLERVPGSWKIINEHYSTKAQ